MGEGGVNTLDELDEGSLLAIDIAAQRDVEALERAFDVYLIRRSSRS